MQSFMAVNTFFGRLFRFLILLMVWPFLELRFGYTFLEVWFDRFGQTISKVTGLKLKMEEQEYRQIKSFGSLIREKRNQLGKDLREFGSSVGVDPSSISRLENEETEATLSTAIRICEALKLTPATLIKELFGTNAEDIPRKKEQSFLSGGKVLTPEDLGYLMTAFDQDQMKVLNWLALLLNRIIHKKLEPINDFSSERGELYFYNASYIFKLLLDKLVYHSELQYPLDLDPEKILWIYAEGGVITFQDVGVFLKNMRFGKKITLAELGSKSKVSESLVSKFETGSIRRVKLKDILIFDNALKQEGKLLTLYWYTSKIFENKLPTEEPKLITIFITLFRWLQHLDLDTQDFMEQIHNEFAQLDNVTV